MRLGLALNLAVFYKEIKKLTDKAIILTEVSLQQAIDRIDDSGDSPFKDSETIIQMLKNNLEIWQQEAEIGTTP